MQAISYVMVTIRSKRAQGRFLGQIVSKSNLGEHSQRLNQILSAKAAIKTAKTRLRASGESC